MSSDDTTVPSSSSPNTNESTNAENVSQLTDSTSSTTQTSTGVTTNFTSPHDSSTATPTNEPSRASAQPPPLPPRQPHPPTAQAPRTARDRLFYALFVRMALTYARLMPPHVRRIVEFFVLCKAIVFLFALTYVHYVFGSRPATCLDLVRDEWPRDGVLRVLVPAWATYDFLEEHYAQQQLHKYSTARRDAGDTILLSAGQSKSPSQTFFNRSHFLRTTHNLYSDLNELHRRMHNVSWSSPIDMLSAHNQEGSTYTKSDSVIGAFIDQSTDPYDALSALGTADGAKYLPSDWPDTFDESIRVPVYPTRVNIYDAAVADDDSEIDVEHMSQMNPGYEYAIEFALEYGLLRLSTTTRQKLGIQVMTVVLDPRTDTCFGDNFSRAILNEFLGYDDVVMASVKSLADSLNDTTVGRGYLRDLITGDHYRFVASWMSRTSYLAALCIMIVFTFATSMLLRFSHHQIFMFIVDLLQMFELNVSIAFPAAPLLTVILALVGMEAIMSEFFNDTSTAFYVILMVWIGDQYDAVCCNTSISRRYWLRFFYLYHFAFYAYHYRFNGLYSGLALLTSWLFIQHSMLYFLNHYEVPYILHEYRIQRLLETGVTIHQQQANESAPRAPPAASRTAFASHGSTVVPTTAAAETVATNIVRNLFRPSLLRQAVHANQHAEPVVHNHSTPT